MDQQLREIAEEFDRVEETLRRLDDGELPACRVCGAALHDDPLQGSCEEHR
jgi:RNA polymerase-binding transcription factor DksA